MYTGLTVLAKKITIDLFVEIFLEKSFTAVDESHRGDRRLVRAVRGQQVYGLRKSGFEGSQPVVPSFPPIFALIKVFLG